MSAIRPKRRGDLRDRRADGHQGSHERRSLPGLHRTMSGSHPQAQGHRGDRQRPLSQSPGVQEAIEAVGATLRYLPPYSPDLSPIELVFHPLKAFLRKAMEQTIGGLNRSIGSFIRTLAPAQCIQYFRHAGYEPV